MAEDKNIVVQEEDDGELFDENAYKEEPTDDEASLIDAMNANPVKLFFLRNIIKLKNQLNIIPMLCIVAAMVILTCTLFYHDAAVLLLIYDDWNALLLFVNVLASILAILMYMRVYSRKTKKNMKIAMAVLFYLVVAFELYIDFRYIHNLDVQMALNNNLVQIVDDAAGSIAHSRSFTIVHIVLLIVSAVTSILAPVLQPFAKKIHIKVK